MHAQSCLSDGTEGDKTKSLSSSFVSNLININLLFINDAPYCDTGRFKL